MPSCMSDYPQVVAVNGKVYISGRMALSSSEGQTVMAYDDMICNMTHGLHILPQYDCMCIFCHAYGCCEQPESTYWWDRHNTKN